MVYFATLAYRTDNLGTMQIRWAFGDSLPASELDVAIANKTLFQNFWEAQVVKKDSVTCSDTLFVYTSNVNILYRNQYRPAPLPPFGFGDDQISIFAEIPDMVLPRKLAPFCLTLPRRLFPQY